MNKLQKNAWINLAITIIAALIMAISIAVIATSNTRGIVWVIILVLAGCAIGPPVAYFAYKDESKYDERERMIRRRAFYWSTHASKLFLTLVCFVPFLIISGQSDIPVYYLPIILCGFLLIEETIQSLIILFQCTKEQDDG